jgi:hypothetical protein
MVALLIESLRDCCCQLLARRRQTNFLPRVVERLCNFEICAVRQEPDYTIVELPLTLELRRLNTSLLRVRQGL